MNSKSIEYTTSANAVPALPQKATFVALLRKLIAIVTPTGQEQARAYYRSKRARAERQQDALNGLSLADKQQLGMHRFMD